MQETLPADKNFLGIEEEYSSYDKSEIVILPVPYEHTVSYGEGTGRGPEAILDASHYVEFWDDEFQRELCFEKGIATLPPMNLGDKHDKDAMEAIYEEVRGCIADGKFVVTLGGEHSISSAPIKAHFERFPGMSVLQFDAHSDLRIEYEGNPWSHASVMARVLDFFPADRLSQLGIRAQCREENDWIQRANIHTFFARGVRNGTYGDSWMETLIDTLREDVYITFDVDYFDPSIMPATGTPEPGGFFWDETIELLIKLVSKRRIIGFDVVELSHDHQNPAPTYLTARLVYKLLNLAFQHG